MIHRLEHPDRVTVGTIGQVGQRLFLLQAREGRRLVVVKVEKDQIAILASWLARTVREMTRPAALEVDVELEPEYEVDLVAGEIAVSIDKDARDDRGHDRAGGGGRGHARRSPLEGAGGGLRHPSRAAHRGGPPAVPAVRAAARPKGPRLPEDERPRRAAAVSRLDDGTAREVLLHGAVEVHGRIQDSSNATLLVTVRLGEDELLAVYKPERGERPLWDFPPGLWRREVAAYELDQLLGTDCVPLTVARDATFGPGSLQRWVHEEGVEHYLTLHDEPTLADWFRDLAAFDVVANNTDRKSGHVLLEDGRCWAIDNGLCFHVDDKLRTVIWEFASEPVAAPVLEHLVEVADGDVQVLKGLLDADEVEATQRRARALLAAGVLPEPDERRGLPAVAVADRLAPQVRVAATGQLTPRPPTVSAPNRASSASRSSACDARHRRAHLGQSVRRDDPAHLELQAVGVLRVEGLGRRVVGLPDQRAHRLEDLTHVAELGQRLHLPGEVVEARCVRRGLGRVGTDREEAEVVVVRRTRGAQEGRRRLLVQDREAERLPVEVDGACDVAHVEHRVVEPSDRHGGNLDRDELGLRLGVGDGVRRRGPDAARQDDRGRDRTDPEEEAAAHQNAVV